MIKKYFGKILFIILQIISTASWAQPSNDNCLNASPIPIGSGGFALGTVTSAQFDMTNATVQTGEAFASSILVSGLDKKSVWFKFSLKVTRSIRVNLLQPGIKIQAGSVGFAVYKASSCLPTTSQLSTKLSSIETFGSTFHPCVDAGDYLIQVSSNKLANGPIYITIDIDYPSPSLYDRPGNAYNFGKLPYYMNAISYNVECQSIENASEVCNAFGSNNRYIKSTWHTFTTRDYFDYTGFLLGLKEVSQRTVIGFTLYEGEVTAGNYTSLPKVLGCDSLVYGPWSPDGTDGRFFKCDFLKPNTKYTLQLFFPIEFKQTIWLGVATGGDRPTQAPRPISTGFPTTNDFGILPLDESTQSREDVFACNSRHTLTACGTAITSGGILSGTLRYNLSNFYSLRIDKISDLEIKAICSNRDLIIRLYKQPMPALCPGLSITNIVSSGNNYISPDCLLPGDYVIQVLGVDSARKPTDFVYSILNDNNNQQDFFYDLGRNVSVSINAKKAKDDHLFNLSAPGRVNKINATSGILQPLKKYQNYSTTIDTFGCANTVLPAGDLCPDLIDRAKYRQFSASDSGIAVFSNFGHRNWYKLYKGDADALATLQNKYLYPERINGLQDHSGCWYGNNSCNHMISTCVTPGTYSLVTLSNGKDSLQSKTDNPEMVIKTPVTKHHSPSTVQDLGDILNLLSNKEKYVSTNDTFSCKQNAKPINGISPCEINGKMATKAIYRQFFLSKDALVNIGSETDVNFGCGSEFMAGVNKLFFGKISEGESKLTPVGGIWDCFSDKDNNGQCNLLKAGWYTMITYGIGPTFEDPQLDWTIPYSGGHVGVPNRFFIVKPPPKAKYNRPYKAAIDSVTKQPFLIEWKPGAGHSTAYPNYKQAYTLYEEHFDCFADTPFNKHPVNPCYPEATKVVYYVFKTTQESYVEIDTEGFWASLFNLDVRRDSAKLTKQVPIQACNSSDEYIMICRLQPGTYTLVVFAGNEHIDETFRPTIYIDRVVTSRFDHAANAYDFGLLPADSTWRDGKPGDINPLNPDLKPSHDFISCTTGARETDPLNAVCQQSWESFIYKDTINQAYYTGRPQDTLGWRIPRRNVWYSFVVDKPGYVWVNVKSAIPDPSIAFQPAFAVYKSNVNGTLPFSGIKSRGEIDSTILQGLQYVTSNINNGGYQYYCLGSDRINFYRNPCDPDSYLPARYYVLVESVNYNPLIYEVDNFYITRPLYHGQKPVDQVEMSILIDPEVSDAIGDFCSNPSVASLNGPGSSVVSSVVDCHTIGTDYGEFNPLLTCPLGVKTSDYKTSWYRLDVGGTDTLDVTIYIDEKTNSNSSDIKYRMMTGDCNAMQEQNCVQDALTRNTYKCLAPGFSYYIQVISPVRSLSFPFDLVKGSIDLNISAVVHQETCFPSDNCIAVANFIPEFDCNKNKNVVISNYSTYGSAIKYTWDFGYNNNKSNAVAPQFFYPALSTDRTYSIKLIVENLLCGKKDSIRKNITIPARPFLELGPDTLLCVNGSPINLDITTHTGSQYSWSNGVTTPKQTITTPGLYSAEISYKNCVVKDTILISEILPFIFNTTSDQVICQSNSLNLSASGANRYVWSGGGLPANTTASEITVRPNSTTTYNVKGYGIYDCFEESRDITVTVIPLPVVNAGVDTSIMVGTPIDLMPFYSSNNLDYKWSPEKYLSCYNCANPTAKPREEIEYTIQVNDRYGCTAVDKIKIELFCNEKSFFIPNTFTPNGDGMNDIWYPRGGGIKLMRYLKVFNRWGQLLFERTNFNTDDRSAGWDGTFKGQPLSPDVFVYVVGVVCDNGQNVEVKGNVMIVR